jgi:hypothetical protein
MREEHPQVLADNLNAERVNCSDNWFVLVLNSFQPGFNVFSELPGDHPVEGDDQDIVTVNC